MKRFQYSLLATAGILILAFVLTAIGPKRVMAVLGYTPVKDVDGPGRRAYHELAPSINTSTVTTEVNFSMVPGGNRLAIENVSVAASVPSGQTGYFFIDTIVGGAFSSQVLPAVQKFADQSGENILICAQPIRVYADPGTRPSLGFRRSSNAGDASFQGAISGYYIGL